MQIQVLKDCPGLGAKIRAARKLDKRPLYRLCEEVGVSTTTWLKIEKEEVKTISADRLASMQAVLPEIGVDW